MAWQKKEKMMDPSAEKLAIAHPSAKAAQFDPTLLLSSLQYREKPIGLTYDVLRAVAQKDVIIAAIIQTRVKQVSAFWQPARFSKDHRGFSIRHKNVAHKITPKEEKAVVSGENFLMNCGNVPRTRDNLRSFLQMFVRDRLELDQAVFEKIRDRAGRLIEFICRDGASFRLMPPDPTTYEPQYLQLLNKRPFAYFNPSELAFCIENPRSNIGVQKYGFGEIEMLLHTITSHLYAEEYTARQIRPGAPPRGLIWLSGAEMTSDVQESLRKAWISQASGIGAAFRLAAVNIPQGASLNYTPVTSPTDMDYARWLDYLINIACFSPTTEVTLSNGTRKPIEQVCVGDSVITQKGTVGTVSKIMSRKYKGKMTFMRFGYSVVGATPDHPVFITDKEGNESFKPLCTMLPTERHKLPIPVIKKEITKIHLPDYWEYEWHEKLDDRIRGVRQRPTEAMLLDKTSCFALGLYAAEGYSSKYCITFAFHQEEKEYIQASADFLHKLNLRHQTYTDPEEHSTIVRVNSVLLAAALRVMFGHTAKERRVPEELLNTSKKNRAAFLSGVLAGDGSIYLRKNNRGMLDIATASPEFASQIQIMFASLGVYGSVTRRIMNVGYGAGRTLYSFHLQGPNLEKALEFLHGPKVNSVKEAILKNPSPFARVDTFDTHFGANPTESWEEDYDGLVYNLSVEGEESYCVGGLVAVHNCAIYQIDPAEVNFPSRGGIGERAPLFESGTEARLIYSTDKGLRPLLSFVAEMLTQHVISQLEGLEDFMADFEGIAKEDKMAHADLLYREVTTFKTLNEVRNAEDLPPLEGGDMVMNPTYIQARGSIKQEQQQAAMGGSGEAAAAEGEEAPAPEEAVPLSKSKFSNAGGVPLPKEQEKQGGKKITQALMNLLSSSTAETDKLKKELRNKTEK